MKENIFTSALKKMSFSLILLMVSFVCYMGVMRGFPLVIARVDSEFQRSFLWLLIGLLVIGGITMSGWISRTVCNIVLVLYFIALGGVLIGQLLWGSFLSIGDEISDPKYYESVLADTGFDQGSLEAFPEHIPEWAEEVEFAYAPQIGQGAGYIALKFTADEEKIKQYMTVFGHKAVSSGTIPSFAGTPYELIANDAGHFYAEIPDTYQVYVLSAQNYSKNWNHGRCSLVGVVPETSEITFYTGKW